MIEPFATNPNVIAVVRVKDGQTFANSRDVAAFFSKRHDRVLENIDKLVFKGFPNFREGSYTIDQTGRQEHRCFDMDRKGFMMLVMRFTGDRALKLQSDYIDAFDAMEAELGRRAQIVAAPVQGSLALAIDTNDSLSNIERHLHSLNTGLGEKFDKLAKAVIGALIKQVGYPILDRIDANQRWNEERFDASYRRDKLMIQSLAAKRDAGECVSIAVAQTMMGVPSSRRSSRLSRNLSANAIHWFIARGFSARPDTSHAPEPWIFQKSMIAEWWASSGRAIYERETQSKAADVVSTDKARAR